MDADDIRTPTLIFSDRLVRASLCGPHRNRHRLGGPLELKMKRWPRRSPRPHRIVTLDLMDPACRFNADRYGTSRVPLIYGLRISGCHLRYQVTGYDEVQVKESRGNSVKDWPYAGYPEMLPTVPLYFGPSEPIDWKELEKDEDWHGLTKQDSRPNANEVLVVVPPNDAYGVSLWGSWGDLEGVQILFRVNLQSLLVEAWNEVT